MKETDAYKAVASNTSGSTPKDLFEDVAEELEKQVVSLLIWFDFVRQHLHTTFAEDTFYHHCQFMFYSDI